MVYTFKYAAVFVLWFVVKAVVLGYHPPSATTALKVKPRDEDGVIK
tara:strand:+ start:64 stop:201 length:138 start_codon:yes stop_codon:yes gene_type:complete